MSQDGHPPRPSRDLQDLLRVCLAHSDPANAPGPARPEQQLDYERRQFLESVINSMTLNAVEDMERHLKVLRDSISDLNSGTTPEDVFSKQIETLTHLADLICSLDNANDFHKIGGFEVLEPLLQSPDSEVRARTADLIAELVQNNPHCQRAAQDFRLLPPLLNLLDCDSDNAVKIKALYGVSCLLIGNAVAQEEFEALDGFSVLMRAMQGPLEKLRIKAGFLLTALCSQKPQLRDTLFEMGFVEQLAGMIQSEHSPSHEYLLGALLALALEHEPSRRECRRPELNLESVLAERVTYLCGKEEFKEEQDYCKQLLQLCFAPSDGSEMDR